jgi:broad specificity phosphatase PhoE
MQFILVRHGATDWNLQGRCQGATDLELNGVGIRQAQETAASLSGETIHGIYSSDLKRARQTADLIGAPHHLAVGIEPAVRELDHGELEGLTFAEIKENYPDFIQRWRTEPAAIRVPGGERLVDVAARTWEGLNRIARRHRSGETMVLVSHNFPILSILCRITGTDLNQYRSFRLVPCGVTRIRYENRQQWSITQINSQHFSPEPLA